MGVNSEEMQLQINELMHELDEAQEHIEAIEEALQWCVDHRASIEFLNGAGDIHMQATLSGSIVTHTHIDAVSLIHAVEAMKAIPVE